MLMSAVAEAIIAPGESSARYTDYIPKVSVWKNSVNGGEVQYVPG
jgi:hypothetical protein